MRSPVPGDKATAGKYMTFNAGKNKTLLFNLVPLSIRIHGDIAFVHYLYHQITKDEAGKEESERGRWTDILKKQGDRWVLIGDHGGRDPKND